MPSSDNLIWIDLEMTGLKPDTDAIIEIATVVTDKDLNIIAEGPKLAIHQPDEVLARMDDWNQQPARRLGPDRARARQHRSPPPRRSGARSRSSQPLVDAGRLARCAATASARTGASWRARCPTLEHFFHYRNLDVSTLKELARRWAPEVVGGFVEDRARTWRIADIHESIRELRHYRAHAVRAAVRGEAAPSVPQASFGRRRLREEQPGLHHRVRVERHALDALFHQPAREVRMIRRPLAADADVLALLAAGGDGHRQQRLHRIVALVEQLARRSPSRGRGPSVSCVMSFEPIDMPSKYSRYCSASSALVGSSHIMMTFRPFSPRCEAVVRRAAR